MATRWRFVIAPALCGAVLAVLFMLASCGQPDAPAGIASQATMSAPPPVAQVVSPTIARPTRNPSEQTKVALEEEDERRWDASLATWRAVQGWLTPIPTATLDRRPTETRAPLSGTPAGSGVLNPIRDGPLAPSGYLYQNVWEMDRGDLIIRVFAGVRTHERSQGVLFVTTFPIQDPPLAGEFPTPSKAGSLRIIGAIGQQLTVQAENGEIFLFDVAILRYVTPGPAATPIPPTAPRHHSLAPPQTIGQSTAIVACSAPLDGSA